MLRMGGEEVGEASIEVVAEQLTELLEEIEDHLGDNAETCEE